MKTIDGHPFECTKCGKCCQWGGVVKLSKKDADRLAEYLRIPMNEFMKRYTRPYGSEHVLKNIDNTDKCIFLKDNKCSVYNKKPKQCDEYPIEFDPRCPGFGHKKERAMEDKYKKAVQKMNEKFSHLQQAEKAVTEKLYAELKRGAKTASVLSKALEEGIDSFLDDNRVKIASLEDLFAFNRVDNKHLIHKATRDLWAIEADTKGDVHIARLFDNSGEPIKG